MSSTGSTRRVVGFGLLALAGATAGPAAAQDGPATPAALVEQYGAALAAGDARRIAGLYAERGIILNPRGPVTEGREAIEAIMARNFGRGRPQLRLVTARFDGDADQGAILWVWETTINRDGQPPQAQRIRSLLHVKRAPEGWRIHADMYQVYVNRPR